MSFIWEEIIHKIVIQALLCPPAPLDTVPPLVSTPLRMFSAPPLVTLHTARAGGGDISGACGTENILSKFDHYTGCPILLGPLSFCHYLGFWSTHRGTFHSHWIAHEILILKLTLLSILREKLTKLQHKT